MDIIFLRLTLTPPSSLERPLDAGLLKAVKGLGAPLSLGECWWGGAGAGGGGCLLLDGWPPPPLEGGGGSL